MKRSRFLGEVAFWFILGVDFLLAISIPISWIFKIETGITINHIVGLATTIFLTVWGTGFGATVIKKTKEMKNVK